MFRFKPLLLGALCGLLTMATPIHAQSVPTSVGTRATAGTYSFHVTSGSTLVDALVTTNGTGHAVGISGLVNNTDPITGLSTYAGADNNIYVTGAWLTFGGLSFSTRSMGDFNIYNSGVGYYGVLSGLTNPSGLADGRVAIAQITPVPEPSTWLMMLVGFVSAGAAVRRSKKPAKLLQFA